MPCPCIIVLATVQDRERLCETVRNVQGRERPYETVPRRCFFYGPFMLFLFCFCYAFVCVCLQMPCGHLLGKLSFVMSSCEVVTFPLVSWVRCGAWLYRFLIFLLFLTFRTGTRPQLFLLYNLIIPDNTYILT